MSFDDSDEEVMKASHPPQRYCMSVSVSGMEVQLRYTIYTLYSYHHGEYFSSTEDSVSRAFKCSTNQYRKAMTKCAKIIYSVFTDSSIVLLLVRVQCLQRAYCIYTNVKMYESIQINNSN